MTEAEWLACGDPGPMLQFLGDRASWRKLRLFGCACCRRGWHLLQDEWSRKAVVAAEQYADRLLSAAEVIAFEESDRPDSWQSTEPAAAAAAGLTIAIWAPARWGAAQAAQSIRNCATIRADEEALHQAQLLRDIFGSSPFCRLSVPAPWLEWDDGTVPKIVQAIYDERRFSDLPILADALEDAGCADETILAHCRNGGEHVRGCWVVDLLLGKS
jgi:hypothetical protein